MTKSDSFTTDSIWKLSIISPEYFMPSLEEIMHAAAEDNYPSMAIFEIADDPENKLMEVYFNGRPDETRIKTALPEMARFLNLLLPSIN